MMPRTLTGPATAAPAPVMGRAAIFPYILIFLFRFAPLPSLRFGLLLIPYIHKLRGIVIQLLGGLGGAGIPQTAEL
jgi:hypothetical protein